ncbi:SMC family ATPase [Nocardioides sp.]|jgi:exonuclease SbcC|uniref:SMC family ATPase n=1 Tax=Nocardioides sp. TaxID=35761 RepID=UPI002F42FE3C
MRLHHLSVTAFGPFVETADVDFDALSDAGLFLLSGATGAGKSSVLDAVCFALYGAVPGDRQHAGRLRSDQAPPTWAPSVTLEVDLSGRRFRIVRSPAWERPKKRGTGTTREQARVSVTEHVDGDWVPLTSRLDEAGDLISGLLGMNLDQFCQVALLPQGHFQAFLRADSAQRHQLLARLFRTGRFERVEAWLRDHRLTLRRCSDQHALVVGNLVSRLSEAARHTVPEEFDDLASVVDEEVAEWAEAVRAESCARRTSAAAAAEQAAVAHQSATAALAAAQDLARARSRVVAAAETMERLDLVSERHASDVARLDRARRAAGLTPLARLADERRDACDDAEQRAAASQEAAARSGIDVATIPIELERTTVELAALTALLPAERLVDELREQEAALLAQVQEVGRADELTRAELATLAALDRELRDAVAAGDAAAQAVPAAESELEHLRTVANAHEELVRLTAVLATISVDHGAARRTVLDLRGYLLDLRERRIAGMAAELAGGLVVGGDCPVCGSPEHPHPALPSDLHPDAEAERTAQRALDDAQAVELALQLRVREVEASLAVVREGAGEQDPDDVRCRLSQALRTLADLRSQASGCQALRTRLEETSTRASELDASTTERRVRAAQLTTSLEHLRCRLGELEAQVTAARGEHPELRAAVATLSANRDLLRTVMGDATALESARESLSEAATALGRAALEAGFGDIDGARGAVLSPESLAELDRSVQEHRTVLAAARQVLDEPESSALLGAPPPEVEALDAAALMAAEESERCRTTDEVARRTDERVRGLAERVDAALAAWSPVRESLALATAVSSFAEGKAPDNRLQMRLSAYVLAHRLSQVVAAANARLAGMSDQRYSLEHVGRRGAGEARGGLSLVVRDDWSGESRDPATLSGGETFVVSLALALGLADVVAHEAGGTDLQTLFVDEGFGSLDAETLDDVLDILDTLRENGRTVGVVSHVAEMRDRIPTQLVVRKARSGSTLEVVGSER